MKTLIALCAAALAVSTIPASAKFCDKPGKQICSSDKSGDQREGWSEHKEKVSG